MNLEFNSSDVSNTPAAGQGPLLRLVFWETTAGCNLECVHCRRMEPSQELSEKDLSTEQGKKLIDQIAAVDRPVLVFSGGEPLMRPDIFELASYAKKTGLIIALATNGTLIDTEMADKIAQTGFDRVSTSLDGADAKTHDSFRGLHGSFDMTMKGLELLRERSVPIQINCTVARHNKHQIRDLITLAERVGAVALHYFLLVPVGCGQQIANEQMLDMNEVEEELRLICELDQKTNLQIKPTCAPQYYRILRQQKKQGAKTQSATADSGAGSLHSITKGCLAATAVCFVSHAGEVYPCGYLPISAGDVRYQNFGEIWRESSVFEDLRDQNQLTGKCGQCEFKSVCTGCRARAFFQFGDYLAEEPYCAYQPKRTAK